MTSDGKRLAYTVSGRGRTVVMIPNTFQHARWAWVQYPEWFEGLARRYRFVHFNYRGQGMSTRGLPDNHSLADWLRDLATIMDAAEVEHAVLIGPGHAGHIAVRYALDHPKRVDALVLSAATIAMNAWPTSLMRGVSAENWDLYLRNMMPHSVSPERYEMLLKAHHETQTQAEFQVAIREIFNWDLASDLPKLNKPLLVMHPRGLITLPIEESERFAAAVPGSQLVIVGGGDSALGDAAESLAAIDSFLAGVPAYPSARNGPAVAREGVRAESLTPREAQVLRLIAAGRSNQQIAGELVLSVRTVERHITNLYAKIGARGKADATAYALRNSLA